MPVYPSDNQEEIDFQLLRSEISHILAHHSPRARLIDALIDAIEQESLCDREMRRWLRLTRFPRKQAASGNEDNSTDKTENSRKL